MIDVLVTGGVGVITSGVSSFITYLLTKKKYNAEVDGNVIQNMKESLDFYKNICDDNKQRLEELQKRNDELQERDTQLEKEVSYLKSQMLNLVTSICTDIQCQHRVYMTKEEVDCRFKD